MKIHQLPNGRIHEGDWLQADLVPGYTLAIVDGPYGMGKAGWDRVKVADLADWYTLHIARLSGLMADSATVYLWNTAEGWARLDPVMRAAGWEFQSLVVWDKVISPAILGWAGMTTWGDLTEVAGVYTRGDPTFNTSPEACRNVWAFDISNDMRKERIYSGTHRDRNGLWDSRKPLHPCQKPLVFAERMIRASSRPGERVLVPFGGTNREAVAIEWMTRRDPAEARQYDACELNQDGPDYIAPVLAQIRGEDHRPGMHRQAPLFGGAA